MMSHAFSKEFSKMGIEARTRPMVFTADFSIFTARFPG
jgi:hypothetical protein